MPSPHQQFKRTSQESGSAGLAVSLEEEGAAQRAGPLYSPHSSLLSVITVLFLLLALFAPAQLYADNIAESTDFNVDTRDYGGSEVAQSGDFMVDTTTEGSSGPAESVIFTLDTRAPSPDLASSQSALFTVNTLDGVPVPLTVHSLLKSTTGAFVGGASIEIKIYGQAWWRGVSGPDGSFYPPEMKAQNYVVTVQKTGYVTLAKNVVGAAGGLRTLPLVITPMGLPPGTEAVNRLPTPSEKADPGGEVVTHVEGEPEAQLMIYGSGAWHQVGALNSPTVNPNAATVILCHGWKSSPQDWPLPMALLISQYISQYNTLATPPNILAWDWHTEAASLIPLPDRATKQGEALGLALRRRLGLEYSQRVHFIGHSMGALVNRFACDAAHQCGAMNGGDIGWNPALTKPHITLLDEAEITSVLGTRVITSATIGAVTAGWVGALREAIVTAYEDWKSPIPSTPVTFIDNYISMVGIQRSQAVNVCLTAPAIGLLDMPEAHSYAHQWYRNTAQSPYSPVLGFLQSYEGGGTLPTNVGGLTAGNLWFENLATPALSDLLRDPNPTSLECNISILGTYSIRAAATIGDQEIALVNAGLSATKEALNGYAAGINWVGDKGGTVIIKTQQAFTTLTEKIGEGWDAAHDKASDVLNSLNPNRLIDGVSRSLLQIHLGGGGGAAARVRRGGAPTTTEPGAWLTLEIPSDAAMMQFDFTVNGPPANDCVAAAVAGQNVFNLPLRYVADGEVQSTDMIDISAYAGQTVEFYFGLVGGTSTNCELVVDGLRFITIPMPLLVLEDHGATVSLHWPSAASGWTLEASPSLAAGSWQEVLPTPGALTVADGVMRLEETKSPTRQFYRLRRGP